MAIIKIIEVGTPGIPGSITGPEKIAIQDRLTALEAYNLTDLDDVVIDTAQRGDTLFRDSTGFVNHYGLTLNNKRQMQFLANLGAATVTTVGFAAAPTLTATVSSVDNTLGPWTKHTTTTTLNDFTGMNGGGVLKDWDPEFVATIQLPTTITSYRLWVGLFSGSIHTSSDPVIDGAGFRYATDVDGTAFWRCWSNDGTSGGTATTTTASVIAGTHYRLRIHVQDNTFSSNDQIRFWVNDVLVATHTTNMPRTGIVLIPHVRLTTLTAAAREISWGRVALSHI
jgi:hypothetical protein